MARLGKAMSAISTLLVFVCLGALCWWGLSAISTDTTIAAQAGGDIDRGQIWMTGAAQVALYSGVGSIVLSFLAKRVS